VILKVWSSNLDNKGGCDFAVVEITPELAKLALRRIAVLREQKALDPAVDETYYWGSEAEFFSPWAGPAAGAGEGEAACLKLEEELDLLQIDRREIVNASGNFSVPQSQIARVECMQMVVREGGLAFTAIPKHTDFYVTTAEIPKELLEQSVAPVNG
jgi:hypothetical protein